MHSIMILMALAVALGLRLIPSFIPISIEGSWEQRWQKVLFCFLFPPLIIFTTVLAILLMGAQGEMLGLKASWFSYWLSFAFVISLTLNLGKLAYQSWLAKKRIATYQEALIQGKLARLIHIDLPYIAQIGFWQPQLVVSQGLINLLDKSQLEAVLAHEQAHLYYRDNFCFFWLSWLRSSTSWLINTENLWEELLLLREIRADLAAAKTVDPLILAESLLTVAQQSLQPDFCINSCAAVGFSLPLPASRLAQRVDALVNQSTLPNSPNVIYWSWLLLLLTPWATIPFHC
jgi:Zn-dependent protease with chaperone function